MVDRVEFGFTRTTCDCWRCSRFCKLYPGYMVPSDLPRMMAAAGYTDPFKYAEDHLEATPGAIAVRAGVPFRIGSLRPACLPQTTTCKFLDQDNHCTIHETSPFGCAFADDHMSAKHAEKISVAGGQAICEDRNNGGLYTQVWDYLWNVKKKRGRDPFAKEWIKVQRYYNQRRING